MVPCAMLSAWHSAEYMSAAKLCTRPDVLEARCARVLCALTTPCVLPCVALLLQQQNASYCLVGTPHNTA